MGRVRPYGARVDLLAHPFRVGPDGAVVTVAEGSDDAIAQAIAVTALTRKGERPYVPDFGVTEPTFADLDVAELNAALDTFGPVGVSVDVQDVTYPSDTTQLLTLSFTTTDDAAQELTP